jgi:ABC-type uncharacterized transport system auxiliary subunit
MKCPSLSIAITLSGLAILAAGCQVSLMSGGVMGGGTNAPYYEFGSGQTAAARPALPAGSWQSRAVLKVSPFSIPEKYGRAMLLAKDGQVTSSGILWKSAPGIAVSEELFASLARGRMFRCVTRESSMTRADVSLNGDILAFELQTTETSVKAVLEVAVTLTDGNRALWSQVIREEAPVAGAKKGVFADAEAAGAMKRCMAAVVSRVETELANGAAPDSLAPPKP